MAKESLALKWGTLKRWNFQEGGKAAALLEEYYKDGVALGAAQQQNTDRQTQLILDIIDAVNCETIYLDWDGEYVSKEEAKTYVRDYNK